MNYEIIKEQLEKVFTSYSIKKHSREKAVKLGQTDSFYAENFTKREYNYNVLYGNAAVKNTLQNSKNCYQKINSNLFTKSLR